VEIAVCVVDKGGNPVLKARMDGASYLPAQFAEDKAWTAAGLGFATSDLAPLVQPGEMVFGISHPRVVTFGGGVPLREGDAVVGGVGVSGGSVDDDIAVAEAALAVWGS
ncbi:MAG: GlcG/HbpS family heme-binding protein, partial [Gaiellaceae bacterium]